MNTSYCLWYCLCLFFFKMMSSPSLQLTFQSSGSAGSGGVSSFSKLSRALLFFDATCNVDVGEVQTPIRNVFLGDLRSRHKTLLLCIFLFSMKPKAIILNQRSICDERSPLRRKLHMRFFIQRRTALNFDMTEKPAKRFSSERTLGFCVTESVCKFSWNVLFFFGIRTELETSSHHIVSFCSL